MGKHRAKSQWPKAHRWLGAGALAVGFGAALTSGSRVAYADTHSHSRDVSSTADDSVPSGKNSSSGNSASTTAEASGAATQVSLSSSDSEFGSGRTNASLPAAITTTIGTTTTPSTATSFVGLSDPFEGTGNVSWSGLPANGTVANGVLTMPTMSGYPVVEASTPIDLDGQSASVQLASTPNTAASSTQAFFQLHQSGTPQNFVGWMWTADNELSAEVSVGGRVTRLGTVAYTPNTQWLRIAENVGTLSWQTSTDGTTWATQASTSDSSIPFSLADLTYKLGTGYWRPETVPTGSAVWDNVSATGNYFQVSAQPHSLAVGVFLPQDGSEGTVGHFELATGAHVKYVLQFCSLTDPVPVGSLNAIDAAGEVPVIALEPWDPSKGPNQPAWSLSTTIAGDHDADYKRWADRLASLPYKVILRPMSEMNGNWYPWAVGADGNTVQQYIKAWRHIYNLFEEAGATNVWWMFAPTTPYPGSTPIAQVFPGLRYVNVLGIDGYNWGDDGVSMAWVDPAALFSEPIRELRALNTGLPIMIAEMGSAEDDSDPARKADWIMGFFDYVEHVPGLTGFIWFDIDKEKDWRANSSAASWAAFVTGISQMNEIGEGHSGS